MKRIFLTGPIGCGKSTLIRKMLGDDLDKAGGFFTERILEEGKLVGFDIVSPESEHTRIRILTFGDSETKCNDEAFSVFASNLLQEAVSKPFAVIDEIGGFEILIPEFMEAFELFLESGVPCIGVQKSLPSADKLLHTTGLSPEYLTAAERFHSWLASYPDTKIVEFNSYEDQEAINKLNHWKKQHLG